ncbi:hypothetical protein [Intestinibacter sp.]|uniref:hypothetical protein n=1 Tax=Intestinibacter sp. TaxID=1965304 RepID=UPI002A763AE1|nr:hypothetical protein [Intestinibacter sp.]MDY2735759.1 hypothetical protein [Intestinibacter sp.]
MASLKKISIGAASYDIIPDAITDSNANYKASCPLISSNTTVEVASNKTAVINSSSTDTQYPSAKAVFTAIQKASREGSFASNIETSTDPSFAPLVSSGGMLSITYLQSLTIPENKTMNLIHVDSGSTVYGMFISGTISTFILSGSNTTISPGKITKFATERNTIIGDQTSPTTSDTTIGQNGLYGDGTIYIAATGASDPSNSTYAFTGSIVNKAGISDSIKGGYIRSIRNEEYATISEIISKRNSTIEFIANAGSIADMISNGNIVSLEIGTGATIGDSRIPTTDNPTAGQSGLRGNGTIYISATNVAGDPTDSVYAFKGSIINKAGISSSVKGGYIGAISNNAYATINQIQNVSKGTITNIENSGYIGQMHNTGTIDYLYADGGSVTAIVGQGSTAGVNLGPSSTYPLWDVVVNGKVNPWQEVSNIDSLITFLNLQTGILYKYTGPTTTYNGVTYTNGNFYRYEA